MEEQQNKKADKLTDKAFTRLALTSIFGILLSIILLCSTTYAWFADSAPSKGNSIKMAASCDLSVTVTPMPQDGEVDDEVQYIEDIENPDGMELSAGDYKVTLSLPKDSASGYCIIETISQINGETHAYYSDYIQSHSEDTPVTISFRLVLESQQVVRFTTRWGIYARESDVDENGVMFIPALTQQDPGESEGAE